MGNFLGSLCCTTGEPAIHIRAHRRRIGSVPPSVGSRDRRWRPKSGSDFAVVTTIHGLSQSKRTPHLETGANGCPRETMHLLTEKLGCRGSVVEDPVSGPVVYLGGDRRVIVSRFLAWGQNGPKIKPSRIKVHEVVDEEWGTDINYSRGDWFPWMRRK